MRTRTVAIHIRVTEAEKRKMEKIARRCGLSLSAYLRKISLGKEVQAVSPQSFYEAYRLLVQLRDNRNSMNEAEISRAFGETIRRFLQAYHELGGAQEGGEVPWQ